MAINPSLLESLLNSIENDRLVIFCGAGLSMSPPSELPSALNLARLCAERYKSKYGHDLQPPDLKTDLEKQAEKFHSQGDLVSTFIYGVVPWAEFRKTPNKGHIALADFLTCGAVNLVVSTNYDLLIEDAALVEC